MGMFDTITINDPLLPGGERSLQTKSLDCLLDNYRVINSGKLERLAYHIEDHSDPTAPPDSFERLFGSMTRVADGWVAFDYDGVIDAYADNDDYALTFARGTLVAVTIYGGPAVET